MSDLNVTTITNSNIAKTDKLLAFNNNDSKAATIQDVVQLVPGVMAVATCSTAGNVATKAVTCADWNNKPGQSILVEFSNANSADNVTLRINSGTAIPVYYMNTATEQVSGGAIPAGAVVFTLNAAGNKFYAHVTKLIEGAGVKIDGSKIEAVNDLPTDAVLHYSFDEVPDYPDGTADVRLTDGNTYQIQSGNYQFKEFRSATFTNSNGNVVLNISADNSGGSGGYISGVYAGSKIVKAKINITALSGTVEICNGKGTNSVIVAQYSSVGEYEFSLWLSPNTQYDNFYITIQSANQSATIEILQIYIGDGSYSTPIIDNANGQNNATNNGGIAVSGVSGKGIYFPSGNQRVGSFSIKAPNSNDNFTISLWLKMPNDYTAETSNCQKPVISIGQYAGCFGFVRTFDGIAFVNRDSTFSRVLSIPVTKDEWHNYIAVYKGQTHNAKIYKDGVYLGSTGDNIANYQFGSNHTNWKIWGQDTVAGYDSTTSAQPGYIDDLLIFDRALTEKEVVALYNNKANTPKYFSKADYLLEQIANNS